MILIGFSAEDPFLSQAESFANLSVASADFNVPTSAIENQLDSIEARRLQELDDMDPLGESVDMSVFHEEAVGARSVRSRSVRFVDSPQFLSPKLPRNRNPIDLNLTDNGTPKAVIRDKFKRVSIALTSRDQELERERQARIDLEREHQELQEFTRLESESGVDDERRMSTVSGGSDYELQDKIKFYEKSFLDVEKLNLDLNKELRSRLEKLKDLEYQVQKLDCDNKNKEKLLEEMEAENEGLKEGMEVVTAEMEKLSDDNIVLEDEVRSLKEQANTMNSSESLVKLTHQEAELERLKEEIKSKTEEISNLALSNASLLETVDDLSRKVEETSQKNSEVLVSSAEIQRFNVELNEERDRFDVENGELKALIEETRTLGLVPGRCVESLYTTATEEISFDNTLGSGSMNLTMENTVFSAGDSLQVQMLKSELEMVKNSLQERDELSEEKVRGGGSMQPSSLQSTMVAGNQNEELEAGLENALADLENAIIEKEVALENLSTMKTDLEEGRKKAMVVEAGLEKALAETEEKAKLEKMLECKIDELRATEADNKLLIEEKNKVVDSLHVFKERTEELEASLKNTMTDLENAMIEKESARKNISEKDVVISELSSAKERLETCNGEFELRLKNTLKEIEVRTDKIVEMNSKVEVHENLIKENELLRTELESVKMKLTETSKWQAQVEDLETQVERLKYDVSEAERLRDIVDAECDRLESELEETKVKLVETNSTLEMGGSLQPNSLQSTMVAGQQTLLNNVSMDCTFIPAPDVGGKIAELEKEKEELQMELNDVKRQLASSPTEEKYLHLKTQLIQQKEYNDKIFEDNKLLKNRMKKFEDSASSDITSALQKKLAEVKEELGRKNIEYASLKVDVEKGELEYKKKCEILQVNLNLLLWFVLFLILLSG